MNGTRPSARKTGRTGSLTIKRVFVSSTTEDLRRAREKVCKTLLSMGLMPIAMDWFPSSPSTVKQRDDEKVQEADAFVILVGHRYGSSPHGGKKSYTELEYDAAWKSGKPLFPFLASEKFLPGRKRRERKEKRDRLLALRRRLTKRHSPRLFDSVDALCTEVSVALATLTGQADEETSRAARQGVAVAEALDGYVSDLVRDLSLWRGLGLGRNVRLEDTYVTHRIMDTSALGKPPLMPEEEVRKTFPDWDLLERLLGAEFQAKCLCITGPAGSGKTTLLRHWALTLAKQSPAQRVPIFLSLNFVGRLCGKGASLDVPLVQLVAQQFPDATGTVRDGLVQSLTSFVEVGRAPILLDGEDEIPEEARKAVWDWIYRLRRSAGQCPMVITSRNAQLGMVQSLTSGWEYFSLDGLDEDQQTDFITRWFAHSGDADSRENMMSQLQRSGPLRSMARTPLFLVMMCIEFEVTAQISNSQAMLFEKFVRTLLEFWDRERGVTRKLGEESKFPLDLKLRALETMASHFFEKDQLVFSERDLLECISGLLTRVDPTAGPHKVVSEIEEKSGLLVSDRAGQYRFCHPLFHEFFVARHYYEKMRKSDAESERIGRLFWDLRFQNVIVFCRELLAGNAE